MELQAIWFFLWGLLWAVFFMTDGFDFGIGMAYPFIAKTDSDKRKMINALGPLWDGNEVWMISAGGVTFAAFPIVYAVMFSSLYSALMLILFALILRGVSFEFRNKIDDLKWKWVWDTCIFIGSLFPALLFGVAFANIFQGLPIDQNGIFHGNLITLLNPYGLLGGALFVSLFIVHGMTWLALRSTDELQKRAAATANIFWVILSGVLITFLAASYSATQLFNNYVQFPPLIGIIGLTVVALCAIKYFLVAGSYFKAWIASGLTIMGSTFFGICGLFPNLIPSSLNPDFSLTAFNASSSQLTLTIMLLVVILFVPVVIAYQTWAYSLFMDKAEASDFLHDDGY